MYTASDDSKAKSSPPLRGCRSSRIAQTAENAAAAADSESDHPKAAHSPWPLILARLLHATAVLHSSDRMGWPCKTAAYGTTLRMALRPIGILSGATLCISFLRNALRRLLAAATMHVGVDKGNGSAMSEHAKRRRTNVGRG